MNGGIPASAAATTVRFAYNDLDSVKAALAANDVACVILEAATAVAKPQAGFLEGVRALCDSHGTLLIFDEITGFRSPRSTAGRSARHAAGRPRV
jgi:glutamate-1-semialdehyde 2,1-aminomutase